MHMCMAVDDRSEDKMNLYKDKYGKLWQKIGDAVWSQETGWGGWWGGKGLTPVSAGSEPQLAHLIGEDKTI